MEWCLVGLPGAVTEGRRKRPEGMGESCGDGNLEVDRWALGLDSCISFGRALWMDSMREVTPGLLWYFIR